MQLEAAGPGAELLLQRRGMAGVALAQQPPVDRQRLGGLQHTGDVPGAGGAGGGVSAVGRPGAPAEHRGNAVGQGVPNLLRGNHVNMGVNAPGGGDEMLAGDDFRAGADNQIGMDAVHHAGVARLAHGGDAALAHPDVGLDDAQDGVQDDCVGDYQIQGAAGVGDLRRLPHTVAGRLAAAENQLIAGGKQILLNLADQGCIGQAETVSGGGAVEFRVLTAADAGHITPLRWGMAGRAVGLAMRRKSPGGRRHL